MTAAARWRGGSRRSLAGLGIRQVWLICHTVVERVGERRVTGRDLGENAAAEATNKEATRMIPRRCESASHVGELASGKALNLANFSKLGIFSRRSGGSAGYLLGEARAYSQSNNYCRE